MAAFLIPIVAAVAGAAVSANASSKQSKSQRETEVQNRINAIAASEKARKALIEGSNLESVFGTVPEAALFNPVDFSNVMGQNIDQFLGEGVPAAMDATSQINQQLSQDTLRFNMDRINSFFPNFNQVNSQLFNTTQQLAEGKLPFEDVEDIISDRTSLSAVTGTPGGQENAVLRDLGMSRLDAMNMGLSRFGSQLSTLNRDVSPIPNYLRADQVLPFTSMSAEGRSQLELQQAALQQQSQQNAFNLAASADPAAAGLFGLELDAGVRNAGIMASGQIPNYSSGIGSAALGAGITAGSQLYSDYLTRQQTQNQQQYQYQNQYQQPYAYSAPVSGGYNSYSGSAPIFR